MLASLAFGGDPAVGEVLAGLAGCKACHTADAGAPWAGGYAIETEFGTFFGSNLTPDTEHGIGDWSEQDFVQAMTRGRSPSGKAYWPAFPYPAFTQMTEEDLGHLWAFMQTLEPVAQPNREHETRRTRFELGLWRTMGFTRGGRSWERADGEHARGEYLGNAVGHCGECHSPRNGIGIPQRRAQHGGSLAPPEPAPSIRAADLGWSLSELASFLEDGWTPEGDVIGGEMGRIVQHGTSRLNVEDRRALAAWLLSVGDAAED